MGIEYPLQAVAVGDARQHWDDIDPGTDLGNLQLNEVERTLGPVDQHQPQRMKAGDLPRQLGADRTARAGHYDDLPRELGRDALEIELHRLAAEQVFGLDVADRDTG